MVLRCLDKFKSLIHLFIHSEFQNVLYNILYIYLVLRCLSISLRHGLISAKACLHNQMATPIHHQLTSQTRKTSMRSKLEWLLHKFSESSDKVTVQSARWLWMWGTYVHLALSFTADILSEEEMYQLWIKDKILNSIAIPIKWKLREK